MSTQEKIALSVTEAAQLLNLSRPTLYKLIHSDGFPVMRVGTRTLIHREKLEEWAARRTEESKP